MTRHIFGTAYRTRSTNSLLAEIDHCVKNLGVSFFNFEDDNLFASQEKAAHLLQALISYQKEQQTKLDLAAMNGISLEQITVEMLPLLVEAGFQELNISLVTAGSSLQAKLGRPFNTTHFEKIAKHANKLGINVRGYFILGHPQQDKHEIEETIKFFKTTNIKAIPSVYYNPMEQKKERWKIQRSSAFANETDYLTRKDLLAYFNQIVFDY